jgi:transcriptional regulator with XRE-family HTH domain
MAIRAHLDQPVRGNDEARGQRIAGRRALRLEASGSKAGTDTGADGFNVVIHNISAAGLLIETALDLAEGDTFALELPEAGAVGASVVWRSERLYGCAFEHALSPAALAAAQLQGLPPMAAPAAPARSVLPRTSSAEPLGTRLNRLRREAGLTLADIAVRLGVSKPTVWAWEKGKARPLPERFDAIAAALGVTPDLLAAAAAGPDAVDVVIAECRQRIAEACNIGPEAVRIMIEL